MRLQRLLHVPFEGVGSHRAWAADRGHAPCGRTHWLTPGEARPRRRDYDMLVVMGGPMRRVARRTRPTRWARRGKKGHQGGP